MPLADSPKRILGFKTKEKYFRNFHGDDELNLALEEGGKKRKSSSVLYDEELYDDRPFYALLLKVNPRAHHSLSTSFCKSYISFSCCRFPPELCDFHK